MATEIPIKERSRKEEITELAAHLYHNRDNPLVQVVLRLEALLFDEARDRLLTANPATFPPLQGEAMAHQETIRRILTKPLSKGDEYV